MPQEEINRLLVEHGARLARRGAAQGRRPVRVRPRRRGGAACREAGVRFEVVPGVTAGSRRPPTPASRSPTASRASAVAFVTGHEDPPRRVRDWPALAAFPGTLVFYMGVRALPRIAERLVAGRPAEEPVAVVERGTLPGQRTLAGHARRRRRARGRRGHPRARGHAGRAGGGAARAAGVARAPAAARPHGRGHARARAGQRAGGAAARARRRGGRGAGDPHAPARRRAADLAPYDLVCVTSPNGATAVRAAGRRGATRARSRATVAAIGPGTARRCASTGSSPTSCPRGSWPRGSSRRSPGSPSSGR